MGFREGVGLGKYGQGRQEIVEASKQKGRRGLGLTLKGFDGEVNVNWQDEPEVCILMLRSLYYVPLIPLFVEFSFIERTGVFYLVPQVWVKFKTWESDTNLALAVCFNFLILGMLTIIAICMLCCCLNSQDKGCMWTGHLDCFQTLNELDFARTRCSRLNLLFYVCRLVLMSRCTGSQNAPLKFQMLRK